LVREVMTSPAVTVGPGATLKQAVRLLDEHRISAMPVVDQAGHLVGVVSEADVLRESMPLDHRAHGLLVEISGPPTHLAVADVMTNLSMSVSPADDVSDVVELLVDTQVKSLPVVAAGRVVGMVSRQDVITALARADLLIEAEVDEALRVAGVECTVEVTDGVVYLRERNEPEVLSIARVVAGGVPGVVGVSVGGPR